MKHYSASIGYFKRWASPWIQASGMISLLLLLFITPGQAAGELSSIDPTPTPGSDCSITLQMPKDHYRPGDYCWLYVRVATEENRVFEMYVIAEVAGKHFFFPSWGREPDSQTILARKGVNTFEVLHRFKWPEISTTHTHVRLWGALMDPGGYEIASDIDMFEFDFDSY